MLTNCKEGEGVGGYLQWISLLSRKEQYGLFVCFSMLMILPSSSQGQIGSSDFHPGLLRFKEVFGIKLQVTFDVIATSPPVSQGNKRQIGRQSCGLSKVALVSIHFLNFACINTALIVILTMIGTCILTFDGHTAPVKSVSWISVGR